MTCSQCDGTGRQHWVDGRLKPGRAPSNILKVYGENGPERVAVLCRQPRTERVCSGCNGAGAGRVDPRIVYGVGEQG